MAPGEVQEACVVAIGGDQEASFVALIQGGHSNMVGGHGRVVTESCSTEMYKWNHYSCNMKHSVVS